MPVCEGCGASFDDNFKFCPNCGRAKPEKSKVQIQVEAKPAASALDCPNCHLADKVQKASAIATGQTHQISGSQYQSDTYTDSEGKVRTRSYSVPYNATQQSMIAGLLSPPLEPRKPDLGLQKVILMFGTYIIGGLIISGAIELIRDFESDFLNIFVITLLVVIILIPALIIFRKILKNEKTRVTIWKNVDIPSWQNAMKRWDRLYYCSRDDIVFILGESKVVPVREMTTLLYEK